MCTKPINRLTADEVFKSERFWKDGKMKPVKSTYTCDNYIQAITLRETLKIVTGQEYDIEPNGNNGWKVVAQK